MDETGIGAATAIALMDRIRHAWPDCGFGWEVGTHFEHDPAFARTSCSASCTSPTRTSRRGWDWLASSATRSDNFLEQSILGGILDLVYSELFLCTRELARAPKAPGLHRLKRRQQQDLARRWREHYGKD